MVKEKLQSLGGGDWKDQLAKLADKTNPKILKKEEGLKNKLKEAEMAFDFVVSKSQRPKNILDASKEPKSSEGSSNEQSKSDTIVDMVKETPNKENQDVSGLSTKELKALGYDILSPEYGNALKREIAESESRIKTRKEKVVKIPESEKLQQLGEEIKKGVDVVVIHGDDATYIELGSGESKKGIKFNNDMDTSVALYILDQAGIQYKKAELVPKGNKSEDKEPGRYLHIDTSGEAFGVQENVDGRTVDMYADHHQKEKGANTSASNIVYKSLIYSKQLVPNNKLGNLVDFVNSYDNLSYVDEKGFNKEYFEKYWATSMHAIGKEVNAKQLLKWFNENEFNKNTYFTKKDAESEIILKDGSVGKLGDLINKLKTQVKYAGPGIEVAKKRMENKGMPMETEELGKVLYNTLDEEENPVNPNKKKNIIPNAFIACKANGYDTYVAYNSKDNRLFINSTTKDLAGVYDRLKAKLPNTVLVRGVMIISINESGVSKEEILKIIGIEPTKEVAKKTLDEVVEAVSNGKMKMEDAIALGFTTEEIVEELGKEGVQKENTETKLENLEKELAEVQKERDTLLTNYNARAKAREEEIKRLGEELRSIEQEENKNEEGLKSVEEAERELKYQDPQILNAIKTDNIQRVFDLVLFTLGHKDSVLSEEQEIFLNKNKSLVKKIIEIQTIKENEEARLIKENTGKSPAGRPIIENPEKFKKDLQKIREGYYQELSNLKE